MEVAGVVYIYPVYPGRITRSERANMKIFQKICGPGGLSKIMLTTSRWDICPQDLGAMREAEIWKSFWADETSFRPDQETMSARLLDSPESARDVVERILTHLEEIEFGPLGLQREMVDKGRSLQQTDAARELRRKILQLIQESKLKQDSPEVRRRAKELADQAKALQIPLSQRVQSFFSVVSSHPSGATRALT